MRDPCNASQGVDRSKDCIEQEGFDTSGPVRHGIVKTKTKNKKVLFLLLGVLGLSALVLCVLVFVEAWRMVGELYPGVFIHRNNLVHVGSSVLREGEGDWKAFDLVLEADGRKVWNSEQLMKVVQGKSPGTEIDYVVRRGGRLVHLKYPAWIFTWEDFTLHFFVFFLMGLFFLVVGGMIFVLRPENKVSRVTSLFNINLGLVLVTFFSNTAGGVFSILCLSLAFLLPVTWMEFTLNLGAESPWSRRSRSIYYLVTLTVSALFLIHFFDWRWKYFNTYSALLVVITGTLMARFILFGLETRRGMDSQQKRMILLVLAGGLISICPLLFAKVFTAVFGLNLPVDLFFISVIFFPILMTYAAVRYNLFDLDLVIGRWLISLIILGVVMGVYLFMVNVLNVYLLREGIDSHVLFMCYLILLVLLLKMIRTRTQQLLDRFLFPSRLMYQNVVRDVGSRLSISTDQQDVMEILATGLQRTVGPSRLCLFMKEGVDDGFVRIPSAVGDWDLDRLPEKGRILSYFETQATLLTRREAEKAEEGLVQEEMKALDAELAIPLFLEKRLTGILVLGEKETGGLYTLEDLKLLRTLADQAAVGLSNAAAFHALRELGNRLKKRAQEVEHQREKIAALQRRLKDENVYLKKEMKQGVEGFENIVGTSSRLREVLEVARSAAQTASTVLITGESGTGKELVARSIHDLSKRREDILVKVNCAAVPAGLVESELFGHEQGAFTDAVRSRKGRFELADGGSLFLDEVGELPLEVQAKLLRVLQEREFERIGGNKTIRVDVRILAATNRDLAERVRAGAFREDLFWRLNVVEVHLPPLREREEDIPVLVREFIDRHNREMGKNISVIQEEAMRLLARYPWPGNVRELANVVERAMVLAEGQKLALEHLPAEIVKGEVADVEESFFPLSDFLEHRKQKAFQAALSRSGGNKARAAQMLGLDPSNFSKMLKKMGDLVSV